MLISRADAQNSKKKRNRRRNRTILASFYTVLLIVALYFIFDRVYSAVNPAHTNNVESPQQVVQKPPDSPNNTDGDSNIGADGANGANAQRKITISFVGDVMMGGKVGGLLQQHGYSYPYEHVLKYLQQPDITVANLESPFTDRGTAQLKEYVFRVTPKAIPAFAEAGFDLVNLANNHILDYGEEGLLDTFNFLDSAEIHRFGAGHDAEEAYKPVIMEQDGVKIAFLGFSRVVPEVSWKAGNNQPGVAETYDYTKPVAAITKAREEADLVIVIAHWGVERKELPEPYQRELAHRYIDAGADLIVGGHPHVLQGFEQYKDKWIAYSLGNFIFTTNSNELTWNTMILQAECSKAQDSKAQGCDLQVVPIITKWAQPKVMDDAQGLKLFNRLSEISFQATVEKDGKVKQSKPK